MVLVRGDLNEPSDRQLSLVMLLLKKTTKEFLSTLPFRARTPVRNPAPEPHRSIGCQLLIPLEEECLQIHDNT